jgi:hypothetical protein
MVGGQAHNTLSVIGFFAEQTPATTRPMNKTNVIIPNPLNIAFFFMMSPFFSFLVNGLCPADLARAGLRRHRNQCREKGFSLAAGR